MAALALVIPSFELVSYSETAPNFVVGMHAEWLGGQVSLSSNARDRMDMIRCLVR